jgi:hypothetical protein
MALAYFALIDVALRRGVQAFAENRLLLMTSSLVLAVPLVIGFLPDNPPRYYAPAIPAALLMCAEWFRLRRAGELEDPYEFSAWRVTFVAALLPLLCGSLLGFVGTYVVSVVPFLPQGERSGLSLRSIEKLYPLAGAALLLVVWWLHWRKKLSRAVPAALNAGVVVQITFSVYLLASALSNPTYAIRAITGRLESAVAPGESIAGDWAPLLALDTRIRALYTERGVNDGPQIGVLRPTFFLNSHTPRDLDVLQQLPAETARLGEPLFLGSLFGRRIELIRLHYSGDT